MPDMRPYLQVLRAVEDPHQRQPVRLSVVLLRQCMHILTNALFSTHEESWTCPRPGCDTVVYGSALLKQHERLQHASAAKSASHAVAQGEGAGNGAIPQGDSSSTVAEVTLGKRRKRSIGEDERQARLK